MSSRYNLRRTRARANSVPASPSFVGEPENLGAYLQKSPFSDTSLLRNTNAAARRELEPEPEGAPVPNENAAPAGMQVPLSSPAESIMEKPQEAQEDIHQEKPTSLKVS